MALVAFIAIERHAEQPMLDLTLFRNRLLSVNLVTGWITFIGIAGLLILLPFYLTDVVELSPSKIGLALGADTDHDGHRRSTVRSALRSDRHALGNGDPDWRS